MSIQNKIDQLLLEFPESLDWESKYKKIIEKGKKLPALNDLHRTDANLIKGCQSQVWLYATLNQQTKKMELVADSDALIVKGLVAILVEIFDQESPAEVLKTDLSFFEKMGLKNHLTPSRANGFSSMIKQIFNYAIAFNYLMNKNN